jgi:thiamine phosphate synthase YjbQ (UPF0047 family)
VEQFVTTSEIEQLIKASVDKTVCVVYADGETENLFVHNVDDDGFVCDLVTEMTSRPPCAYWVRFTDILEARPAGDESEKK